MANKPFFTADDFLEIHDVPDTTAVTVLTAAADVVVKTLSFSNSSDQIIKIQVLINDQHFSDVNVLPYSGYDDGTGNIARRFEAFAEGLFPSAYNVNGQGKLGLKLNDTLKVKLYAALPASSTFNVALTGSNT